MTVPQKDYFKNNWITFANLILLLGIIVQQSRWQQRIEIGIDEFNLHKNNTELHMPFKEQVQLFTPRYEIDRRLDNIERTVLKIEKNQEKN
jgi:aspartyl/asparaginyl-tRNA synthetase